MTFRDKNVNRGGGGALPGLASSLQDLGGVLAQNSPAVNIKGELIAPGTGRVFLAALGNGHLGLDGISLVIASAGTREKGTDIAQRPDVSGLIQDWRRQPEGTENECDSSSELHFGRRVSTSVLKKSVWVLCTRVCVFMDVTEAEGYLARMSSSLYPAWALAGPKTMLSPCT